MFSVLDLSLTGKRLLALSSETMTASKAELDCDGELLPTVLNGNSEKRRFIGSYYFFLWRIEQKTFSFLFDRIIDTYNESVQPGRI